jgi:hypothetical protein
VVVEESDCQPRRKEIRQRIDKNSGKLLPIEIKDFDLEKGQ